jgi:hypothetical protein
MIENLTAGTRSRMYRCVWAARARLEAVDERGGGRNTDEGFHIAAGAVIAGSIAAGVSAYVATKLGALK